MSETVRVTTWREVCDRFGATDDVERVARAICRETGIDPDRGNQHPLMKTVLIATVYDELWSLPPWFGFVSQARAAMAAIQAPVPEALNEIKELLLDLYEPHEAFDYLFSANSTLDGHRAIDLIAAGESGKVLKSLKQVVEGVYL